MEATTTENTGSLLGSILMIAGCCIGAGMISLPAITAVCGFLPSVFLLLFSWIFMVSTGLLLLEVSLLFPKSTNLMTMAQSVIGKTGRNICAVLFIFLFGSLIIAYLSGSGILISDFFSMVFKIKISAICGNVFTALFLLVLLIKGTNIVDWMNRLFVFGMVLAYGLLVVFGLKNIHAEYLNRSFLGKEIFLSLPVLLISFGYQNLIPSITTYLGKNKQKIQTAIIIGCSIPLLIYLIWEFVILGMISGTDVTKLGISGEEEFILHFLQKTIDSPHLFLFIHLFSLLALLTSLITIGLSFIDFLRDQMRSYISPLSDYMLPFFIAILPLICSIFIPNLFLRGLSLAGGFGAVIIFGGIPIIMSWNIRYRSIKQMDKILPGGKTSLICLMIISLMIFIVEFLHQFRVL